MSGLYKKVAGVYVDGNSIKSFHSNKHSINEIRFYKTVKPGIVSGYF